MATTQGVASRPQFGPHPITVEDLSNITPQALEQLAQYIEQRGLRTPVSNLVGFAQFLGQAAADVPTSESTASTFPYVDLATVGPSLSSLGDGKYLLFFGCNQGSSGISGYMSVSLNGSTPTVILLCDARAGSDAQQRR